MEETKDELSQFICNLYKCGVNQNLMAKAKGVHPSTICRIVKKIHMHTGIEKGEIVWLDDKETLLDLYDLDNKAMTTRDIGELYMCSPSTVYQYLKKYLIKFHDKPQILENLRCADDSEKISTVEFVKKFCPKDDEGTPAPCKKCLYHDMRCTHPKRKDRP
jgi:hypothetical protein